MSRPVARPANQVPMLDHDVPLVMYTAPLLIVHVCEAIYDNVLVVPRLPVGVRYSVYAATFYLTMLFGNFGGAEFIYFQF